MSEAQWGVEHLQTSDFSGGLQQYADKVTGEEVASVDVQCGSGTIINNTNHGSEYVKHWCALSIGRVLVLVPLVMTKAWLTSPVVGSGGNL